MYAEVIVKWVKIFDARQEARTKFSIAVDMRGLLVERIRLAYTNILWEAWIRIEETYRDVIF